MFGSVVLLRRDQGFLTVGAIGMYKGQFGLITQPTINLQKDIQRIFSLQVGLPRGLIREAIQKNVPPSLIVVLFVPEIPPKVNGFVTLSGGGVGV